MRPAWIGKRAALAAALLVACAPTELQTDASHPASSSGPSMPLPPVAQALEPDFEPRAEGASAGGAAEPAPAHEHAAPASGHSGALPVPAPSPGAQPAPASEAATVWTCPMHPQVRQPGPGKCPICGMQLKPVAPEGPAGGSQ